MSEFHIGEAFSSYTDVEAKIKAYQREKFVQLNRRDSRTLGSGYPNVSKVLELICSIILSILHVFLVGRSIRVKGRGRELGRGKLSWL